MALRDTLKAIQDREQEAANFESRKPEVIAAWQESIRWLLKEVRAWLAEYESDGAMTFSTGVVQLDEELLGAYQAETLSIHAGPAGVRLVPVGRMIIGATGRVDIYRQGRPGDSERIKLLRTDADRPDAWALRRPQNPMLRARDLEPLNRENFEAVLDGLLSS